MDKIDAKKFLESNVGDLTFAKMLRSIRECNNMSQMEFSEYLNIPLHYLMLYETVGVTKIQVAIDIAKKLQYSEKLFVKLALQTIINNHGLNYKVELQCKQ